MQNTKSHLKTCESCTSSISISAKFKGLCLPDYETIIFSENYLVKNSHNISILLITYPIQEVKIELITPKMNN